MSTSTESPAGQSNVPLGHRHSQPPALALSGPSWADARCDRAPLPTTPTTEGRLMRCDVCLSNYGGPLALCPSCLSMVYPKGLPKWVLSQGHVPAVEPREHPALQH